MPLSASTKTATPPTDLRPYFFLQLRPLQVLYEIVRAREGIEAITLRAVSVLAGMVVLSFAFALAVWGIAFRATGSSGVPAPGRSAYRWLTLYFLGQIFFFDPSRSSKNNSLGVRPCIIFFVSAAISTSEQDRGINFQLCSQISNINKSQAQRQTDQLVASALECRWPGGIGIHQQDRHSGESCSRPGREQRPADLGLLLYSPAKPKSGNA